MRTESWCGHNIRFVEVNGEWYAILKDICDALELKTSKVAQRLDPSMLEKVRIDACDVPLRKVRSRNTQDMLVVNELGIYEALFASRRLEARKFRMWAGTVMKKLRAGVGLEQYEVMRMTDPEIQERIDYILDRVFWDEENQMLMESVTVRGGDVEQVPFEGF